MGQVEKAGNGRRSCDGTQAPEVHGSDGRGRDNDRRLPQTYPSPLDDCLYALQETIPHLTRSPTHRCLHRHGISRLPGAEGGIRARKKFKEYPIGFFHVDITEARTEEGRLRLFVAVDRTSKFAFAAVNCHRPAVWVQCIHYEP